MKLIKNILLSVIVVFAIYINGCDDAGVIPDNIPRGTTYVGPNQFRHLDQAIDGFYKAWVKLVDSNNAVSYVSLGEFNVDPGTGAILNLSGGPMTFAYSGDTNLLDFSQRFLISVETVPAIGTPTTILISGAANVTTDSIHGLLDMSGVEAFGTVADSLKIDSLTIPPKYIINTPTDLSNCQKGIWFCDTTQTSRFPEINLSGNPNWIYQGWILNRQNPGVFIPTGRFNNPAAADDDGAGPCKGPNGNGYNNPGQDWIISGGSCPNITSLLTGTYEVFITVEPKNETGTALNSPFFLKVYYQNNISSSVGCNRTDNLFNQSANFPTARIVIAN